MKLPKGLMKLIRRLSTVCLRIPERGADVISILLASAGINIITSAQGSDTVVLTLVSGFVVSCSGIAAILLKYRIATIRKSVSSEVEKQIEALEQAEREKREAPKQKSEKAILDSNIADFLDNSSDSVAVERNVLVMMVSVVIGVALYSWAVCSVSGDDLRLLQHIETAKTKVISLGNEVARLTSESTAISERVEVLGRQTEAQSAESEAIILSELKNLNSGIENSVEQLRADIAIAIKYQEVSKKRRGSLQLMDALVSPPRVPNPSVDGALR